METLDRLLEACGRDVEMVARPGAGVDRTLIRQMLALSPAERLALLVRQWEATRVFDPSSR